jgi:ABC-2 type transport system permease protein
VARVVLRLKLALYSSELRKGGGAAFAFVMQCLFALAISLWLANGLASHDGVRGSGEPLLVAAFTVAPAYWLLTALLAISTGDLLPIPQLRAFPLTRWQLATGLAAAALVGFGPWVTLIALLGAVRGFAAGLLATPLALVAVLVEIALCMGLSLLARALVAAAGAGRRARDRAVLLSAVFGMAAWGIYIVANRALTAAQELRPSRAVDVAGALPPGALGRAVYEAGRGRYGVAVLLVAYGAAGVAALGVALAWALGREPRVTAGRARAARASRSGLALLRPFRPRRAGRATGTLAAELRQQRRDPRRISGYLFGVFLTLIWTGPWVLRSHHPSPYFAASFCVLAPMWVGMTMLAFDGSASWMYAVSAGRARAELLGKAVAIAAGVLSLATAAALALAVWSGRLAALPAVLASCVAACAVMLGVGVVVSVRFAAPVARNASQSSSPRGIGAWLVFPVTALLLLPGVIALVVSHAWLGQDLPGALVATAYGLCVWWLGLRWAARHLEERRPEIVAALSGSSPSRARTRLA